MHLYIIRHADPNYNPEGLTENGIKESLALAPRLKELNINKIYSSSKLRAIQTAKPTAELLHLDIQIEPWLNETEHIKLTQDNKEYCIWDTYGETVRGNDTLPTQDNWNKVYPFNTEEMTNSWTNFRRDADNLLKRLGYERINGRYKVINKTDDRVAIFCHNGTFCYFIAHLLEIPLPLAFSGFFCWPSSVTDIYFDQKSETWAVPRALCVADTSHLSKNSLKPQARGMGDWVPEYY